MSSDPTLTPTSYIVLGLLAAAGASTPYALKQGVAGSIGHFWSVPHSQLYAEPERLAYESSERYGYPAGFLARYFEKLRYRFGPRERAGLLTFLELAHDVGELDEPGDLGQSLLDVLEFLLEDFAHGGVPLSAYRSSVVRSGERTVTCG